MVLSGSSSVSPTTFLRSRSHDGTDLEKNVDSLFKVYTIAEVAGSLSKMKAENQRLKSQLFSLIGENYGKIIEAADAVSTIKEKSSEIVTALESNKHFAVDEVAVSDGSENRMDSDSLQQIKTVMGIPMEAWKLFKSGQLNESLQLCLKYEQYIRNERRKKLISMSAGLLTSLEIQLRSLQKRIRTECEFLLSKKSLEPNMNHELLKQALLIKSGLGNKTYHTEEDVQKEYVKVWDEIELSHVNLKLFVAKIIELLALGESLSVNMAKLQELALSKFLQIDPKSFGQAERQAFFMRDRLRNPKIVSAICEEIFEIWFKALLQDVLATFPDDMNRVLFVLNLRLTKEYSECIQHLQVQHKSLVFLLTVIILLHRSIIQSSQRPLNPMSVKYLTSLVILRYFLGSFYLPLRVIWRIPNNNKFDHALKFFSNNPGCLKKLAWMILRSVLLFQVSVLLASLKSNDKIYDDDSSLHYLPSDVILKWLFHHLPYSGILRLGMTSTYWKSLVTGRNLDILQLIEEFRTCQRRGLEPESSLNSVVIHETLKVNWPKPLLDDPYEVGVHQVAFKVAMNEVGTLNDVYFTKNNGFVNSILLNYCELKTKRTLSSSEVALSGAECLATRNLFKMFRIYPLDEVKYRSVEFIYKRKSRVSREVSLVVETEDIRHLPYTENTLLNDIELFVIFRYAKPETSQHLGRLLLNFPSPAELIREYMSILFEKVIDVEQLGDLLVRARTFSSIKLTIIAFLGSIHCKKLNEREYIWKKLGFSKIMESLKTMIQDDHFDENYSGENSEFLMLTAITYGLDFDDKFRRFIPWIELSAAAVACCLFAGREDIIPQLRLEDESLVLVHQLTYVTKHLKLAASVETLQYIFPYVDNPLMFIQWTCINMTHIDARQLFGKLILKSYLNGLDTTLDSSVSDQIKSLLCPAILRFPGIPACFTTLFLTNWTIYIYHDLQEGHGMLSCQAAFQIILAAFCRSPLEKRLDCLESVSLEDFKHEHGLALCLLKSVLASHADEGYEKVKLLFDKEEFFKILLAYSPEHFQLTDFMKEVGRNPEDWLNELQMLNYQGPWHADLINKVSQRLKLL